MKNPIARLAASLTALATLALCAAWGQAGHAIIAEIASHELTPTAKAKVEAILNGVEMPTVASWADSVRPQEAYRWTAPLHYVNMADDATGYDPARDCPAEGCVVSGIHDFAAILADPNADEKSRREALMFLIHFVGDLHQPLHAGRAQDKGGNAVRTVFMGEKKNLHSVWDSGIIDAGEGGRPWPEIAAELRGRIDDADRAAWLEACDGADLTGTAGRWAFESRRLAARYAYPVADGSAIGEAYVGQTLPVVELRLEQAGVRLGALLNGLLDPASGGLSPSLDPASVTPPAPETEGEGAD